MLLYFPIMGNYRKALFLNRGLSRLTKPEQEYVEKLAKTLLQIQNSGEFAVEKQRAKAPKTQNRGK